MAERILDADPADVWAALTDFDARPQMLPDNYQDFHVERNTDDASVALRYRLRAGGRERDYHMEVTEITPGRMLSERDQMSSYTTHWLVERVGPGEHTRVRVSSEWESHAAGVSGFFERQFAPLGVRRIHQETLVRLGRLVRERQPATAGR